MRTPAITGSSPRLTVSTSGSSGIEGHGVQAGLGLSASSASRELQALLDAAVDAIIIIDHRGHIELFNHAAERLFGDRAGTRVLQASGLTAMGLAEIWAALSALAEQRRGSGEFAKRRRKQADTWMWDIIRARLLQDFREYPAIREALPRVQQDIAGSKLAPSAAARSLLALFEQPIR